MSPLLGNDLDHFAARHNLGRRLHAASIVNTANRLSEGRYQALSFRNGKLVLTVPTHAVRYRIQTKLADIQQAVNAALGSEVVTKIVVRIVSNDQHIEPRT